MRDPASALRFDASSGSVVRRSPGTGYGNWVGGKAWFDRESGLFTLFYRERRPLEAGRGAEAALAVSEDGESFEEVWRVGKDRLHANSIEEGHCVRTERGWALYLSYEVVGTSTWRIDLIEGPAIEGLDPQRRRTVLAPGDYGLNWVKDPFLLRNREEWWLYAAAPPRTGPAVEGPVVTAGPLDSTVLARSADGRYFPQVEYVFEAPGDDSWHGRRARINSVIPWEGGFVAFYDGGRTFYDNYEEKAGVAVSPDGKSFTRIATEEPWLSSPHGTVRYVCAVPVEDEVFFYYEYTTDDLSHELRVARVRPRLDLSP